MYKSLKVYVFLSVWIFATIIVGTVICNSDNEYVKGEEMKMWRYNNPKLYAPVSMVYIPT